MKDPESFTYRGDYLSSKLLIIVITICAMSLFMFKFLGKGERALELAGIGITLFSLGLFSVYYTSAERIPRKFGIHIVLLFILMIVSAMSANYFHQQSFSLTFYEMKILYYYSFYFLIHYLAPRPSWIKDFVYWLAIIGAVLYLIQYFAYPTRITEAKMFIDRGTLRINLPGSSFRHLAYFLCVLELFRRYTWKYGLGALLLFVIAILSAYRSILAMYILLPAIYLLFNRQVKNRMLIILLGLGIMVSGFFAFQGIIFEMQESALKESRQGTENIRYRAAEYYMKDSKKNPLTFLIGNGMPSGHSQFGKRISKVSLYYGYYLSDIGIVGTVYRFGFIFALIAALILIRILTSRLPTDQSYLKMFTWMQVFLIVSTYPFYEDKTGIIILSIILYSIELEKHLNPDKKL